MKQAPDTLIISHYHLLTGGVRSAVLRSLAALQPTGWLRRRRLRFLVGRAEGTQSLREYLCALGLSPEIIVNPTLDYRNEPWVDSKTFTSERDKLARWFLSQARGTTLFWIHNPTLAKNPLVTAAWKRAAERADNRRLPHVFLYHIHDFAECGRMQNLFRLRRCWTSGGVEESYPPTANVSYLLINRSDRERLRTAGMPHQRLFYVPNVIAPRISASAPGCQPSTIAGALSDYALGHGYRFESRRPWWLLPVRLIRRKNVLETALLAALAHDPPQILVTLDANSRPERPYAEAVKKLVKDKRLPMVIGFGHRLVGSAFSLNDLFATAAAVVTTSLLEGFGFAFLDGPVHGKPLLGRNLPDITEDFRTVGFPAENLYNELLVPVDEKRRRRLLGKGLDFARRTRRALGLDANCATRFETELENLYGKNPIDFGFLDLETQAALVARCQDHGWLRELKRLNPGAGQEISCGRDLLDQIVARFGPQAHRQTLLDCFQAALTRPGPAAPDNVGKRLLELFFHPAHHKPLYGGWS